MTIGPHAAQEPHPDEPGLDRITITGLRKRPHWRFLATVRPPHGDTPAQVLAVESQPRDEHGHRIPLTAAEHRSIPIGEVIRLAESQYANPYIGLVVASLGIEPTGRPYGGGIDHLRDVAMVYRAALVQGAPTAETIAVAYGGVSEKTVSRWLSEARKTIDPHTGKPVLGAYEAENAAHGLTARERAQVREGDKKRAGPDGAE